MARPLADIPSPTTERTRRYRERKRRGVYVIPATAITDARRSELAKLLGLERDATGAEISEALAEKDLAGTRSKPAD